MGAKTSDALGRYKTAVSPITLAKWFTKNMYRVSMTLSSGFPRWTAVVVY